MTRIEEIRAANHQGDVSAKDIAWLCRQAELAADLARAARALLTRRDVWEAIKVKPGEWDALDEALQSYDLERGFSDP